MPINSCRFVPAITRIKNKNSKLNLLKLVHKPVIPVVLCVFSLRVAAAPFGKAGNTDQGGNSNSLISNFDLSNYYAFVFNFISGIGFYKHIYLYNSNFVSI